MSEPDTVPAASGVPLWGQALLVGLLTLVVLLLFADRSGFEGDDINSVVPMLHLPEALAGHLLIYRPDWQPLSYVLGSGVYGLTGSVNAIFALAQLSIAAGVGLLYYATRHVGLPWLLFLPLLMLFPEILYTGLYFNSTALGFPLACLAVVLGLTAPGRGAAVLTGLLLATAVLIRMDFVLVAPVIVAFRLWFQRDLLEVVVIGLASAAVFALALLIGLLDPAGVIETYTAARDEIVARANEPGWDAYEKRMNATVVFSPIGWGFLLVALLWTAFNRKSWLPLLIGLICMGPMLFAARNMLTPKYMVPAFTLLPVIAALIWVAFSAQMAPRLRQAVTVLWVGGTLFYLVASVEPVTRSPFISVETDGGRVIGTHDGPRPWGGYLWHMDQVATRWAPRNAYVADVLAALQTSEAARVALVGTQNLFEPAGIAWRNLQLLMEQSGYPGTYVGPGALRFDLGNTEVLLMSPEALAATPPEGACMIRLEQMEDRDRLLPDIEACPAG